MKKSFILIVSVIILKACTKPNSSKNIISEAEPVGFIDSLSHRQCRDLPEPEIHD